MHRRCGRGGLVLLYLCLVDEEDDIGDGVDGHIDAQLHRPTVADPGPAHTHTQGHTGGI